MNNIKRFFKKLDNPITWTIVGAVAQVGTAALTIVGTAKAVRKIDQLKEETGREPTVKEVVKTTYSCYIPMAGTMALSMLALIRNGMDAKAKANALATVCENAAVATKVYRDSCKDICGPEVAKKIEEHAESLKEAVVTTIEEEETDDDAVVTFKESWNGHTFESTMGDVKKAINDLVVQMNVEDRISLNDVYYELGIRQTKDGDNIGWRADLNPFEVDINPSNVSTKDGDTLCWDISFIKDPSPRFLENY